MQMATIYFDMDGTIANLYAVDNWLDKLRAFDPSPYLQAKPMINLSQLARELNKLQREGWSLGVVSWLSKDSTSEYEELVKQQKKAWLQKHLKSVQWNEIHLVKYGTPKHEVVRDKFGILFDDNDEVRSEWKGMSFSEKQILEKLKTRFN